MLEQIAISYFKDLPEPGFELTSPVSPALASRFFTTAPPEPLTYLPVSPFALSQEFSLHTLPKGSFSNIAELITSGSYLGASLTSQVVKNPSSSAGDARNGFDPSMGKIPWRRKWPSTPVFLLRKSHGQRSLRGHSP